MLQFSHPIDCLNINQSEHSIWRVPTNESGVLHAETGPVYDDVDEVERKPGEEGDQRRVEHSHWSRSIDILRPDWLRS